ncbi:33 kDa inner dynein arm light chain, axonemal-like [Melanaphis sacchari]|uniref:33 kDa inner dynein arm light chain, axonemal-like n=1 Tax=Melanaphis sacchari TaxID=742174 RepID=UPI000DC141FC|nr:33 kDa inner dynein arm light chain, axonemal-like [Melanaphis sacchari]
MNNIELFAFLSNGVLKWNFFEDITDTVEQNNDVEKDNDKNSILEEIFPPREWTQVNNKNKVITLRQTISREPSNRDEVAKMIVMLNHLEQFYRFKKKGICETRNYVYNLFFDEILRQVVILDEDLGAVLYRIQKEFKNTIFILKYMLDKAVMFNNLYPDTENFSPEFLKEVEELKRINNDLKIKYRLSKQRYLDRVKKKESGEDYKLLILLKVKYRMLMNYIKRSTEQLKEQMNMMTPSTKTSYLIQSKINSTKL